MPAITYQANFLNGLSDLWTRFFADSDQLSAMYDGMSILVGQSYLDLLSSVLNLSMQDTPIFNKELYKLILIQEDQVAFQRGASSADDRWVVQLADGVVHFATLDNRVIEPTASLQLFNDFNFGDGNVQFKLDPTDPLHDGNPTTGYARRIVETATGGAFDDTGRGATETWGHARPSAWPTGRGVVKGDVLRLLYVNGSSQIAQADFPIVLVRDTVLYVSADTPLPAAGTGESYVILREPTNPIVETAALVFASEAARLLHTRIDRGSIRIFSKQLSSGEDVIEGVDYMVDYEQGIIHRLTTWTASSSNRINYTWHQEVWPSSGGSPPRFSATGIVRSSSTTARVYQMSLWAPDTLVDRMNLANNYGSLIGIIEASSEGYRALLRGIFQLYLLGPVVERIESALNVILGFPVIRDDGETLVQVDLSLTTHNTIVTSRGSYGFPKSAPLRTDLVVGMSFMAFEPLTTAATVTDYIQDPTWWHNAVIPPELFAGEVPSPTRRTSSPIYVEHLCGADDDPRCGDPGLFIGTDEEGHGAAFAGQPVYRRRVAFVLMDQLLKFHTFFVRFDNGVFADPNAVRFARSFDDLQRLITSAKPAHTYAFLQPQTFFLDTLRIAEEGYYQPPNLGGQDPDGPELFASLSDVNLAHPYAALGLFFDLTLASPAGNDDNIVFQDTPVTLGVNGWNLGDYFHYELTPHTVNFPALATPVAIAGAPAGPRRARFVRVFVDSYILAKRLVEGIDYSVNYAARTVTRLTNWDTISSVVVTYVQLNIGNTANAPADATVGDMPLLGAGVDPASAHAAYDPLAVDWFGNLVSVADHRDLSLVERALTIRVF